MYRMQKLFYCAFEGNVYGFPVDIVLFSKGIDCSSKASFDSLCEEKPVFIGRNHSFSEWAQENNSLHTLTFVQVPSFLIMLSRS